MPKTPFPRKSFHSSVRARISPTTTSQPFPKLKRQGTFELPTASFSDSYFDSPLPDSFRGGRETYDVVPVSTRVSKKSHVSVIDLTESVTECSVRSHRVSSTSNPPETNNGMDDSINYIPSTSQTDNWMLDAVEPPVDTSPLILVESSSGLFRCESLENTDEKATLHQSALVRAGTFTKDTSTSYRSTSTRKRWSQVRRTPILGKSPIEIISSGETPNWATRQERTVRIQTPVLSPKPGRGSFVITKTPLPPKNGCIKKFKLIPTAASTPFTNPEAASVSVQKNIPKKTGYVPDFKAIHERQYAKMENIVDMVERNQARAQYLLSGVKALSTSTSTGQVLNESRKKCLFGDTSSHKKRLSLEKKVGNLKSRDLPKPMREKMEKIKNRIPVAIKPVNKENKKPTEKVEGIGKKLPEKQTRKEEFKVAASKSRVLKDRSQISRVQTAVVRTNRRFELLMQMRAKARKP